MALRHNHKIVMAFAVGWLVAIVLPPQTVLGKFSGGLGGGKG